MPAPPEPRTPRQTEGSMTARRVAVAMLIGTVLILGTAVAARYTEMVTGRYILQGVPPLPAIAALLCLSLLRPLLRRMSPRLAPTHAQVLLIYAMLTVSTILSGAYHIRAFLPHLVSLQYWGQKNSALAQYAPYLPSWYAPRDMEAIKHYYEGSSTGAIPWGVWVTPLFWWSLFLGAIFIGIFSLVSLIQRQWIREERLSFPLLAIPLAVSHDDWASYGNRRLRRSLFCAGFGVAVLFNGINITHVFVPSLPSFGFYYSFSGLFPDRPWTPLESISIFYMLEAIGIGYFVPLEVSFSIWFFYLLERGLAVAGTAAGYDLPSFPFTQDQAAGGYVAMGLLLLWGLRRAFARSLRQALDFSRREPEVRAERLAWAGLIGSVVFVLGFCYVAGFSLLLAVPFFGILGLFVLVFARIRAETGVPFGFVYPYGLPKEMLLNTVSIPNALHLGGTRSFVLFSSLAWLSRHHLPEEQAAYQLDSVKLAEEARIPRKALFIALLVAFVVGLGAAYWVHLSAYYAMGSNMAGGGDGSGEFRAVVAMQEYQQMASRISAPPTQQFPRLISTLGGFCFVTLLSVLRSQFLRFPLHPLGFLIATAYGDSPPAFFPMFVAWLCKAILLRAGGLPFYRRGIPFFLGLAIGHFFCAGIFWPVLSLFIAPAASSAYHLYFGG